MSEKMVGIAAEKWGVRLSVVVPASLHPSKQEEIRGWLREQLDLMVPLAWKNFNEAAETGDLPLYRRDESDE